MENERHDEPKTTYDLGLLGRLLDRGLCYGPGNGEGAVCVEQAVALCAGLPLTDQPDSCVAKAVSAFGRRLNDRRWSSDAARAAGLREFAFAQLGTAGKLDERRWVKRMAELVIREIVPAALRSAAKVQKSEQHKAKLEEAAKRCEAEGTEEASRSARGAAYAATYAADAAAYAAADAAAYAAYAAAAADAATYAADAAAYAAAYAAAAAADTYTRSQARDEMLGRVANIAVRAIREQLPA